MGKKKEEKLLQEEAKNGRKKERILACN